jgi:hypothetical protein
MLKLVTASCILHLCSHVSLRRIVGEPMSLVLLESPNDTSDKSVTRQSMVGAAASA